MTNVLRFPPPPAFIPIRAYHAVHGIGPVVAVLFQVTVDHRADPEERRHDQGGNNQAVQGVGAGEP